MDRAVFVRRAGVWTLAAAALLFAGYATGKELMRAGFALYEKYRPLK
jgi:hypothetical protein